VTGAWRFQQRLHRVVSEALQGLPAAATARPEAFSQAATELRRAAHKTIAGVSMDIEAFHFNKAVARLYELANSIGAFSPKDVTDMSALRETLEIFVRLIGPMTPHLGEELWQGLGHKTLLSDAAWPVAEAGLLVDDTVTVALQVNGKLRGTMQLPKDSPKEACEAAALANADIQKAMADKPAKREIVVPNRLVNVVV
jgi:leucyl-tRNA synthetase